MPEAYRQKFRDLKKDHKETYVEFARQKEQLFDDWCRAKEVTNFPKLRDLMLLEEFKCCVSRGIKLYIEEVKADTLSGAAVVADEYALTHRNTFKYKNQGYTGSGNKGSDGVSKLSQGKSSPKPNKGSSPSKGNKSPSKGQRLSPKGSKKDIECFYCKRRGHVKADCYALKRLKEKDKKPVGLVGKRPGKVIEDSRIGSGNTGLEEFKEFLSLGTVAEIGKPQNERDILVLRDTGAAVSVIHRKSLPEGFVRQNNDFVLLGGFPETVVSCPLEVLSIDTNLVKGPVKVAIVDAVPEEGVDFVLGNDLAGGKVGNCPHVSFCPSGKEFSEAEGLYRDVIVPVGALTRAARRKKQEEVPEVSLGDSGLFNSHKKKSETSRDAGVKVPVLGDTKFWDRESLIKEQGEFNTSQFLDAPVSHDTVKPYYAVREGVLYRVSRSPKSSAEDWEIRYQILILSKYRWLILQQAHENVFGGHLGVAKTFKRIAELFYWPKLKKDVKQFVTTCHECQMIGSPNVKIPKAPLITIPSVGEPFEEVVIDVVGPLPRTKSGKEYVLTLMDRVSRYPEAIPLSSVRSIVIVDALVNFFTKFGLPKILQSDCGTNFTSKVFKSKMEELGIQHQTSVPYRPELPGVVERFHQTLKSMIKKYGEQQDRNWDKELPYLLFAIRSAPNDSLGFAPFELVFGHRVRGPLDVIHDYWEGETGERNLLDYVTETQGKLHQAWSFAKQNLVKNQKRIKKNFDLKAKQRNFEVGQKALVLLPMLGHQLQAKFSGPYQIVDKNSNNTYVIETPNRKRRYQKCHVNMMNPYFERTKKSLTCLAVKDKRKRKEIVHDWPQENSDIIKNLDDKLKHLSLEQREQLKAVILEFPDITKDTPGKTSVLNHDVETKGAFPVKQGPYRVNPDKNKIIKQEVEYMLNNELVQPSLSPWSSPVVLVRKENGQYRLCIDYRNVNALTITDSFPLRRVDDCIGKISKAKYLSKFDLLKGYWQVPLTDRAREISAIVTNEGLYECLVMPFGFKNSACTFQRLMSIITRGLEGCVVYIDDVVVFSDDWETHVHLIRELFCALRDAGLVINLAKCDFGRAEVTYLGHVVGHGKVLPKDTNIRAIVDLPTPSSKREVRKFIGMAGYYRKFIKNFSDVVLPLTDLLRKEKKFQWSVVCEEACQKIKSILTKYPLLRSQILLNPLL